MNNLRFVNTLIKEMKSTFKNLEVIVLLLGGPIFLTLLFGGVYVNTYVEDIPIAVLDEDDSSMSRMIIQQFDENDRFNIRYHVKSKEELKKVIDTRQAHMGLYIPYNFANNVNTLRSAQALIVVDGTNIVIGNNSFATAANIIQTIAAGAQIKLIEAKGVVPQLTENMAMVFHFNDRILYDPRMTYMNYLLLGFIAVFLQQVILSGIGISVIKNGPHIAKDGTLLKIMINILSTSIFALISTLIAIKIASNIFKVPIRGNLLTALLMCTIFIFAISGPAIIIASIVKDKLKFAQISFMLSLPTFVSSGYVWPQEQMPASLTLIIKSFWPLIYFARPFDEVLFKGASLNVVLSSMFEMVIYTFIWLPISVWFLKKRFKTKTE